MDSVKNQVSEASELTLEILAEAAVIRGEHGKGAIKTILMGLKQKDRENWKAGQPTKLAEAGKKLFNRVAAEQRLKKLQEMNMIKTWKGRTYWAVCYTGPIRLTKEEAQIVHDVVNKAVKQLRQEMLYRNNKLPITAVVNGDPVRPEELKHHLSDPNWYQLGEDGSPQRA